MLLTCLQENLSKGINTATRLISTKSQLPILSNVLLKTEDGRLKISSTNLEIGLNLWIGAKIEKEGSFTVPAKVLSEFVNSLPKDKVKIELKENSLKLSCLSYSATINGMLPTEFPEIPSFVDNQTIRIKSKLFYQAISQVAFCSALDEGRPVLTGILMIFKKNSIELVATDGYRLSIKKISTSLNISEELRIIVPARALIEVSKIIQEKENKSEDDLQISLLKEGNQIIFHYDDFDLVTRLIEGQFPSYEKIIPKETLTTINLSVTDLLQAVKVASIFARESANIIKLKTQDSKLKISANAPQVGENETDIDIKQQGEETKIAFNSRYLIDLLNNIGSQELIFESSGNLSPGVFKPVNDDSFLHVIMPVRLQEEQ